MKFFLFKERTSWAELGPAHIKVEISVKFEFEVGVEVVIKIRSYEIDTKLYSSGSFGSSWSFTT